MRWGGAALLPAPLGAKRVLCPPGFNSDLPRGPAPASLSPRQVGAQFGTWVGGWRAWGGARPSEEPLKRENQHLHNARGEEGKGLGQHSSCRAPGAAQRSPEPRASCWGPPWPSTGVQSPGGGMLAAPWVLLAATPCVGKGKPRHRGGSSPQEVTGAHHGGVLWLQAGVGSSTGRFWGPHQSWAVGFGCCLGA